MTQFSPVSNVILDLNIPPSLTLDMLDTKPVPKPKTIDQIIQLELEPHHAIDPIIVKFIYAYLETRHVGDAARSVGIKKYSGDKIMGKPDVQNALREINKTLARAHSFDAGEILERMNEVAQFNPQDLFNTDGTIKDITQIPPEAARTIKKFVVEEVWDEDVNGIKRQTGRIIKVEFWDKLKAGELLGKFEGVFKDTVKHEHEVGGDLASILLAAAEQRALNAVPPMRDVPKLSGDPVQDQLAIEVAGMRLDD